MATQAQSTSPQPNHRFALLLRYYRQRVTLSQAELADIVGNLPPLVAAWETGIASPPSHIVKTLAHALHLTDSERAGFLLAAIQESQERLPIWPSPSAPAEANDEHIIAKPKIFVSHSTKDNAFATKLVADLKAAGADAWLDLNDMTVGSFPTRISQALDACEWFLLVLTDNALKSRWVRLEVDSAFALMNQGRIRDLIFIKAENADLKLPGLWNAINYFNAIADYDGTLAKTLHNVGLPPAVADPTPAQIVSRWSEQYGLQQQPRLRRRLPSFVRVRRAVPLEWQPPPNIASPDTEMHRYITRGRKYLEESRYDDALWDFERVFVLLRLEKLRDREPSQNEKSTYNDICRKAGKGMYEALMAQGRIEEAYESQRMVSAELPFPD